MIRTCTSHNDQLDMQSNMYLSWSTPTSTVSSLSLYGMSQIHVHWNTLYFCSLSTDLTAHTSHKAQEHRGYTSLIGIEWPLPLISVGWRLHPEYPPTNVLCVLILDILILELYHLLVTGILFRKKKPKNNPLKSTLCQNQSNSFT